MKAFLFVIILNQLFMHYFNKTFTNFVLRFLIFIRPIEKEKTHEKISIDISHYYFV